MLFLPIESCCFCLFTGESVLTVPLQLMVNQVLSSVMLAVICDIGHSSIDISVISDTQRPWSFVQDFARGEIRGLWWRWWWYVVLCTTETKLINAKKLTLSNCDWKLGPDLQNKSFFCKSGPGDTSEIQFDQH